MNFVIDNNVILDVVFDLKREATVQKPFFDFKKQFRKIAPTIEKNIDAVLNHGRNSLTTLRPKTIIPVDLFCLPADYDPIMEIAAQHNPLILTDSAQGFGSATQTAVCFR